MTTLHTFPPVQVFPIMCCCKGAGKPAQEISSMPKVALVGRTTFVFSQAPFPRKIRSACCLYQHDQNDKSSLPYRASTIKCQLANNLQAKRVVDWSSLLFPSACWHHHHSAISAECRKCAHLDEMHNHHDEYSAADYGDL